MVTDTICAIATAQGGAIGIVRVSGKDAIDITSEIFSKDLSQAPASTLIYGHIIDKEKIIDEVLVSIFKAPRSYTGENSSEISCHGSSYILQKIIELLLSKGARLAEPGEFTKRAFINGKMDLSQAEAVADLIAASTSSMHKMAMSQMKGNFSKALKTLRDKLLHITSLLELELDFSDHEDLEFANREELRLLAMEILQHIQQLCESFKLGNAIKKGVPTAIVGETNAGKSTLLNALLGEERAIVSSVHGTTRDAIEDTLNIDGILFRLIDTAGIRETNDTVENLGISKTFDFLAKAEIIIWVIDASNFRIDRLSLMSKKILNHKKHKEFVIILNKTDIFHTIDEIESIKRKIEQSENNSNFTVIPLSAKTGNGLELLRQHLKESAFNKRNNLNENDVIVSNIRHYEALCIARESIRRVLEGMKNRLSGELLSQDLRLCIRSLSDIIGDISSQDVLHNVFKHFCIGK